jgi:hypothetical protein
MSDIQPSLFPLEGEPRQPVDIDAMAAHIAANASEDPYAAQRARQEEQSSHYGDVGLPDYRAPLPQAIEVVPVAEEIPTLAKPAVKPKRAWVDDPDRPQTPDNRSMRYTSRAQLANSSEVIRKAREDARAKGFIS